MNSPITPKLESADDEATKSKISAKLYFASLYFITVGVLYLWGYWPRFGINILEFMEFTDILKVTAYPIVVSVLTLFVGSFLGTTVIRFQEAKAKAKSGASVNADERTVEELQASIAKLTRDIFWFKAIYVVCLLAASTAAFLGWLYAWIPLPFLISIPFANKLSDLPQLKQFIADRTLRLLTAFLIVTIPTSAYSAGRIAAENIIKGNSFYYVISDIADYKGNIAEESLRFIGHAGDYIFLFDSKKEATLFIKLDDDKAISLKKFKKEVDFKGWRAFREKLLSQMPSWSAK